jgi:hypothetical protein
MMIEKIGQQFGNVAPPGDKIGYVARGSSSPEVNAIVTLDRDHLLMNTAKSTATPKMFIGKLNPLGMVVIYFKWNTANARYESDTHSKGIKNLFEIGFNLGTDVPIEIDWESAAPPPEYITG